MIDVDSICEGVQLGLANSRALKAFTHRFSKLLSQTAADKRGDAIKPSDSISIKCTSEIQLHNQLRSEVAKLYGLLPELVISRLLIHCGHLLLNVNQNDVADGVCFQPLTQAPNDPGSESSSIKSQAYFGRAQCAFKTTMIQDPKLLYRSSVDKAVKAMDMIQTDMGRVLKEDDSESLCWIIHNGSIHLHNMSQILLLQGHTRDVIPYINWCILAMETCLPLCSPTYLSWRITLYSSVASAFFQLNDFQAISAVIERALKKVNELQLWLEADLPIPLSIRTIIVSARSRISKIELTMKYATDQAKINEAIEKGNYQSTSGKLRAVISTMAAIPLPDLNYQSTHEDKITNALEYAIILIKSCNGASDGTNPSAVGEFTSDSDGECWIYQSLLRLCVVWGRHKALSDIISLIPNRSIAAVKPMLLLSQLSILALTIANVDSVWEEKLKSVTGDLLSLGDLPYPDLANRAFVMIYRGYISRMLYQPIPDKQIGSHPSDPSPESCSVFVNIFLIWIKSSPDDPMLISQMALELACRPMSFDILIKIISGALHIVYEYRSSRCSHLIPSHSLRVDLLANNGPGQPDSYHNTITCLHADLLMALYRAKIASGPLFLRSVIDEIGQDRLSKSLFWIQLSTVNKSDKSITRLARAQTLLLEHDEAISATEATSHKEGEQALRLAWITRSSIGLYIGSESIDIGVGWRIYGKDIKYGVNVTTSDVQLKGLGIDLEPGQIHQPVIISGLSPNTSYVFALRPGPSSHMGPVSHPYTSSFPIPAPLCWAYLSQAAFQLGVKDIARFAAHRAIREISFEVISS
uniref:Uncharacterized protein n=1 Tax=Spongospora subterranea TaxID=70186 RepID=A0A0H5QQ89_9EUKA|eukprot:CRZ03621.1 hypothetical protein [Spongospora subterranea]